eukprot:7384511-Prymnesium_polylepis.2
MRRRLRCRRRRTWGGGGMAGEVAEDAVEEVLRRRRIVSLLIADAPKGDRATPPEAQPCTRNPSV